MPRRGNARKRRPTDSDVDDMLLQSILFSSDDEEEGTVPKIPRRYIERDFERAKKCLIDDYFAQNARYPASIFKRRFRMSKGLFLRILADLNEKDKEFQSQRSASGRSAYPIQKLGAVLRVMCYGTSFDFTVEYFQLGESKYDKHSRNSLNLFLICMENIILCLQILKILRKCFFKVTKGAFLDI
jgi:hypothetical protein